MTQDAFVQLLAEKGYKVTNQRILIYNTLLENNEKHLSPEELHTIVSKVEKDIGIATVYRTLLLFEELGLVYKDDFDDNVSRYELTDGEHHHHHLICQDCGKIIEVKSDLLKEVESYIEDKYVFHVTDHDLKFYGVCSDCQENK